MEISRQTKLLAFKNLIKFLWLMRFHFSWLAAKFSSTMSSKQWQWQSESNDKIKEKRTLLYNNGTSSSTAKNTNNTKIQFLLIQSKIKCISLDGLRCVERMMTLCAFFLYEILLKGPNLPSHQCVSPKSLKSVHTFNGIRNVMPHLFVRCNELGQ